MANDTITSKSGKIITLRPPKEGDTQIMLDFINGIGKEDIYVNVNPDDLYTKEQEAVFLKSTLTQIENQTAIYYLAFDQGALIGTCSVHKGNKRRQHTGNFGIIIKKEYRGDGIGSQLAKLVIQQAVEKLKVSMIILKVFQPNELAIKIYENLGFKQYGYLPNGLSYKDGFIDEIMMYKTVE